MFVSERSNGEHNLAWSGRYTGNVKKWPKLGPRGSTVRTSQQMHEIILFHLIWGEAANLRHMPECLCFLFFICSCAITYPDEPLTQAPRQSDGGDLSLPLCKPAAEGALIASPEPGDFLFSIVTPIYNVLRHELLTRREEPVYMRIMYDDVNEAFWDKRTVRKFIGSAAKGRGPQAGAYTHFRQLCLDAHHKDPVLEGKQMTPGVVVAMRPCAPRALRLTCINQNYPLHLSLSRAVPLARGNISTLPAVAFISQT